VIYITLTFFLLRISQWPQETLNICSADMPRIWAIELVATIAETQNGHPVSGLGSYRGTGPGSGRGHTPTRI
jgi:hypothetical protein